LNDSSFTSEDGNVSGTMSSLQAGLQNVAIEHSVQNRANEDSTMDVQLQQDTSMHSNGEDEDHQPQRSSSNEGETTDDDTPAFFLSLPEECREAFVNWKHDSELNEIQFWDSDVRRVFQLRKFSQTNDAAARLSIAVYDEVHVTASDWIRFLYNWFTVSAAVKTFVIGGKPVKKVFLQRCMLYRSTTRDYPYFLMEVFISTCNKPILGLYVCDLEKAKDPQNVARGTMFTLLKHGIAFISLTMNDLTISCFARWRDDCHNARSLLRADAAIAGLGSLGCRTVRLL
jgi:hypothetical protein